MTIEQKELIYNQMKIHLEYFHKFVHANRLKSCRMEYEIGNRIVDALFYHSRENPDEKHLHLYDWKTSGSPCDHDLHIESGLKQLREYKQLLENEGRTIESTQIVIFHPCGYTVVQYFNLETIPTWVSTEFQ